MAEPFLAEIRMMSFPFAPRGWAVCNGQLLPINQNQALFSLLGTTFGGDGRVNFALPNLQTRVPLHMGNGHTLGERGGEAAHTLSQAEMPQHSHGLIASTAVADDAIPTNHTLGQVPNELYADASHLVPMNPAAIAPIGGSQAHTNEQPYLVINFCIALQGIFPSQN
jgi:microcystin-dependent protein